ncbi:hypothetical protein DEO72_LG11g2634 [Vigna unguiculata]|uniref:Uncharacterized protein n=1 Tax=Vigna unguiculata TaxID=3917 RepID=A0A4D6NRM2_VIGUN|nr:hypothetical protein DEO72_LG11g2634 [Vigna unguiculata]
MDYVVRSSRRSSSLDLIQSRRGGDLPWERSGEYSMCPNSAEFGNRHRCKPPRDPMSLT